MASSPRILNISNGHRLKRGKVARLFEQCLCAWVEEAISIRNLSPAEIVTARGEQARLREPLAYAEVHGLRFEPPASGIAATRQEGKLIWQAHDFALGAA